MRARVQSLTIVWIMRLPKPGMSIAMPGFVMAVSSRFKCSAAAFSAASSLWAQFGGSAGLFTLLALTKEGSKPKGRPANTQLSASGFKRGGAQDSQS